MRNLVVDIQVKTAPSYNVASLLRVGPYRNNILRPEFDKLAKWAKKKRIKRGKWILIFHDEDGKRPENKRRWEACLEIKGKAGSEGKLKVKKLPKLKVATVKFNPNQVSARLVYHGLYGWIEQNGDFKDAGPPREIYPGSPWTNPRAWANAEVQVPIKKK